MNLYKLHAKPESLDGYHDAHDKVPKLIWHKYRNNPAELKKREATLAKYTGYAYQYAKDVLKGPFPAGEEAIAKDTWYAYHYAKDVLKGPFPEGEAAIAKDALNSYYYARDILKGPFPEGEAAIATDHDFALSYAIYVINGRFPEGEAAIRKNARTSDIYFKEFLRNSGIAD